MENEKKLLKTLISINSISQEKSLNFSQKSQEILYEILDCVEAKRGSIMLKKGRSTLEVIASSNKELIGVKQPLSDIVLFSLKLSGIIDGVGLIDE